MTDTNADVINLPPHIRAASTEKQSEPTVSKGSTPATPTVIPDPPQEMAEGARPYWDHYAECLMMIGTVIKPDTQALAMLSNLTEEYWRADAMERSLELGTPNNIRWTAISQKRSVEKQLMIALNAFGLTPAARIKLRG